MPLEFEDDRRQARGRSREPQVRLRRLRAGREGHPHDHRSIGGCRHGEVDRFAVNGRGEKFSKQTHAPPIARTNAAQALHAALRFLGQSPPPELAAAAVADAIRWALANWQLDRVPRVRTALPEKWTPEERRR